jgi:hypothetical protein
LLHQYFRVIAGLDPAIHLATGAMGPRIKSADDASSFIFKHVARIIG